MMTVANWPLLSLTCLETADSFDTHKALENKTTVFDFWTTRCTRCPIGLDFLDQLAEEQDFKHINFVAICCDSLDGARQIIDKEEDVKWRKIKHYFLNKSEKERAKALLGFRCVPFYVVVDPSKGVLQYGKKEAIDFEKVKV